MTSWPTKRMKFVLGINERSLGGDEPDDLRFRYLDIGSVGRGVIVTDPQEMAFGEAPSRARRLVRPGDTIVSTVRTYLRAVWPVAGRTDDLVVSTGFAVLTPRSIDPRFLGWWAQSDLFVEQVVARSVGVSYPAINARDIGDIHMPVPPPGVQRQVADFLDARIERIDALRARKDVLSRLLQDRFWTWFSAKLNSRERPMIPLRRTIDRIVDGPFGSALKTEHYTESGVRVIRLGNIGFAEFRDSDKAYVSNEHAQTLLGHRVAAGDLLIAGLGDSRNHVGRAAVAPELGDAIVKADCYCATTNDTADARFLALWLSSPEGAQEAAMASRGSTRSRINVEIAKTIRCPLVPLSEQRALIAEAETERRRVDRVFAALRRQAVLLDEHRRALITAAVVGDLDVSGVAA